MMVSRVYRHPQSHCEISQAPGAKMLTRRVIVTICAGLSRVRYGLYERRVAQ